MNQNQPGPPADKAALIAKVNLTGSDETLEQSVLGSLLIDSTLYEPCERFFAHSEMFTKLINRVLFEQIKAFADKNRMFDFHDIVLAAVSSINALLEDKAALRKRPTDEVQELKRYSTEISVMDHVQRLIDRPYEPTLDSLKEAAQRLQENWLSRRLYLLSADLQNKIASDKSKTVHDHLRYAQEIIDMLQGGVQSEKSDLASLQVGYLQQVDHRMRNQNSTIFPSGFIELDRTAPLLPTEQFILAARPGMGKTAMMLVMALAAAKSGKPVIIFSLEMQKYALINRFVQYLANINSRRIAMGGITQEEFREIEQLVSNVLSKLDIVIVDDVYTIEDIWRRVRAEKFRDGLIMADYLQLARTNSKFMTKDLEIAEITMKSKFIAKTHNSCFLWASQLSRDVEKRGGDKRPVMSDLLYSGSIERDADVVAMLYRESYYSVAGQVPSDEDVDDGEIIIRKNREGSLKTIRQQFLMGSWQSEYLADLFPELNLRRPARHRYNTETEDARISANTVLEQMAKSGDEDIPF